MDAGWFNWIHTFEPLDGYDTLMFKSMALNPDETILALAGSKEPMYNNKANIEHKKLHFCFMAPEDGF